MHFFKAIHAPLTAITLYCCFVVQQSPHKAHHLKATFSRAGQAFSFLFYFSLSAGLTGRTSSTNQMAKDAPWLSQSLSLLCSVHDLLRGGAVSTPCVCMCAACLCLACQGTNTLWLKLSYFSHLMTAWHMWRRWEQGADESEGHQAVSQEVSVCVHSRVCPRPVTSSSGASSYSCQVELRLLSDDRHTLVSLRGH